jgi:hypothetical protein
VYSEPVRIGSSEYVVVQCGTHQNYHMQHIPRTARVRELLSASASSAGSAAPAARRVRPHLLVTLIDALSRRHFLRALPLTAAYLRRLHDAASASASQAAAQGYSVFEFVRYHVLGHNTRPNVLPLFCGTFAHWVQGAAHRPGTSGECRAGAGEVVYEVLQRTGGYLTSVLDDHCQVGAVWCVL